MKRLLLNALVILGVWESTSPDMLLGPMAAKVKAAAGETAVKPLFDCPVCMSSFWGLAFYFFGHRFKPLWHVLSLCGLMKLIMRLVFTKKP
jgi:hypothetical protein